MAFVRWRGGYAQLLTTIYTWKGSRQVTLACLPEFEVSLQTRNEVMQKHPDVQVDWIQVSRALAEGPPERMKEKIPDEYLDMAEVEIRLRMWAASSDNSNDANRLRMAADVLVGNRQRHYFANERPRTKTGGRMDDSTQP